MPRRDVSAAADSEPELLDLAQHGNHDAFERLTGGHRRELHLHCYRMLGSFHDADDLVQETYLRAWRALGRFESRSSIRTWLYRIATNACLNALAERPRRALPSGLLPPSDPSDSPREPVLESVWLEPYPDRLLDELEDPASRYARRETVELAFLVAIQFLPPKQRAVLLLRDVLAWTAAEVAALLDTSATSVNSTLRRARATLERHVSEGRLPATPTAEEQALRERYVLAFERADVQLLAYLLAEDVEMTMPPDPMWFRGRADVLAFLERRVFAARGPLLGVATAANRHPAVALYEQRPNEQTPLSIQVLSIRSGRVGRVDGFVGGALFPAFGLPAARQR
jgi:RNA polymerase sigma-70 factor, ECF subfamily